MMRDISINSAAASETAEYYDTFWETYGTTPSDDERVGIEFIWLTQGGRAAQSVRSCAARPACRVSEDE